MSSPIRGDAPSLRESEVPRLNDLSDDAKCILGGMFGFGTKEVIFHMREGRPTQRAQAAFDELVAKHALWVEPYNELGGVRYKPLTPLGRQAFTWLSKNLEKGRWSVTEPIKAAASTSNRKDGASQKEETP